MDCAVLLIVLASCLTPGGVTMTRNGHVYDKVDIDDKEITEQLLFEVPAKTSLHCALKCNQDEDCVTFTFRAGMCLGHSTLVTSCTALKSAPGAKSFSQKKKDEKDFTRTVTVLTDATYNYHIVTPPAGSNITAVSKLSFAVKTCMDAHLMLRNDNPSLLNNNNKHEIVIGGWTNTLSVIRKAVSSNRVSQSSRHHPLDCNSFKRFYVSWQKGLIAVGTQRQMASGDESYLDDQPFMTYQDESPFTINYVFVASYYHAPAVWEIDFPCTAPGN